LRKVQPSAGELERLQRKVDTEQENKLHNSFIDLLQAGALCQILAEGQRTPHKANEKIHKFR